MSMWSILKKVRIFIGSSLFLTISLTCGAEVVNEKIIVTKNENIEIVAKQGVFSVSGWSQNSVEITGHVGGDFQVEREGSTLILRFGSQGNSAANDSLDIKVPNDRRINVTSENADFSFDGLQPQSLKTSNLDTAQAQKFDSDISVASIDGDVSVSNSSGDFNINTVNGDILISGAIGVANIRSVSGQQKVNADFRNVSSSNVSGQSIYKLKTLEKLNLKNVNGNTSVESSISPGASIQMQSVNGDVKLLVPQSTSARFSLESHQGGTVSHTFDAPLDASGNEGEAQVFALADASASVTINTMAGDIVVGTQKTAIEEYGDENYDWSSVDTSLLNFAFVNPNHNVFDYQEIFIKQPKIEFDPSWERKYGKGAKGLYRKRIETEYAKLFKKAIGDVFSQRGKFKIVDQRKENALVIIPKVLELYIDNPESVEIKNVLTATRAGNAKIDLVIFSPSDNAIIALFLDKRSTGRPGGIPIAKSRLRNSRAFSRLFNSWLEDIVKVLHK